MNNKVGMNTVELTWGDFEFDCNAMIFDIKRGNKTYDHIVGIGRGGLVPAVICSHKLGVPLFPINWQTRDGTNDAFIVAIFGANALLNDWSSILIVDDINDSGRTMQEVSNEFKKVLKPSDRPVNIEIATVYQKSSTVQASDYIGRMVGIDEWIVFPWED
jgi:uncharacterized protein